MTYIHTGLPFLPTNAQRLLNASAFKIQGALLDKGQHYELADINDVLAQWLASSTEQLCEEACEMCITGDRHNGAFNRQTFENLLKTVPSMDVWEARGAVAQLFEDQSALSLDRAA
jgi:hypothetical protein